MADDDYAERLARGEPRAVLHAYGHPGAYERVTTERDEARAAAWPGDGHWTREPVKVEGWYICGWRDEDGHICVPELRSVGPRLPLRFLEQRWSVPVLVDALAHWACLWCGLIVAMSWPPVPEE